MSAQASRLLRERLTGRACLVVLDDVWQLAHARAFDVLEGVGRLLVTTRDRSILTALGARDLRLGGLAPALALDLLAGWADRRAHGAASEASLDRGGGRLSAAGPLAGGCSDPRRCVVARRAGGASRTANLVFLDHPYGSVFKAIQASVNALKPEEAARYIELAVFPEDVDVPIAVVEELWHATSGWDSGAPRRRPSPRAATRRCSAAPAARPGRRRRPQRTRRRGTGRRRRC